MTVAPRIPTASSTLSVPANRGVKSPLSDAGRPSGSASTTWNAKPTAITPTSPAITVSSGRKPRGCSAEDHEGDDAGEEAGREERDRRRAG